MNGKFLPEHISKFMHAVLIFRTSNIENPSVAAIVIVLDNSEKALDSVFDIGETAFLPTTVNQTYRAPFHQIQDELGDHP